MAEPAIREALPTEPRVIIKIIHEGTPPVPETEAESKYHQAREALFNPSTEFSATLVDNMLQARAEELKAAISKDFLHGASDRGGFTLGSLAELTRLAIQELNGELHATTALVKQLELVTEEQQQLINHELADSKEGLHIDRKSGAITVISYPNEHARAIAKDSQKDRQEGFDKGKLRLQGFISGLQEN